MEIRFITIIFRMLLLLWLVLQHRIHNLITRQQTLPREPGYKRINIFVIGELPRRAIQPERLAQRR
jgi:hypothetical protein